MKLITYNVNSIRSRYNHVQQLLTEEKPDLLLLQEIKCTNDIFRTLQWSGYKAYFHGEKSYNGVAILYKENRDTQIQSTEILPKDTACRFLHITLYGLSIICVYVPNGQALDSPKYTYKLEWLSAFEQLVTNLLYNRKPFVIAGDFNIIPYDIDCTHPEKWYFSPLGTLEVRNVFRRLLYKGCVDPIRLRYPNDIIFTYWDYFKGAFEQNRGLRIDHFLLSPDVANHIRDIQVLTSYRTLPKPSDHAPVMLKI